MNTLKTLRTHWKKSLIALCVSAYGVKYVKGKFEEWHLMKEYCLEAKKHGQMPLSHMSQPRKVAVILNPASNRGRGREVYKEKVAPLLHLAAFDVNLMLTKQEGDGKKLLSELEETGGVVIAAGDGTVSEVVTGLMKRPDEQVFSQTPLCVVPLGRTNTLAHLLHPSTPRNNTHFIAEMVMSLVDAAALKYVDVFSVQAGEDKKVYGVGSLSIGAFTDSNIKRNTWFYRLWEGRVGYFLTSLFGWRDLSDAMKVSFSSACGGCKKCMPTPLEAPKRWWSRLLARATQPVHQADFSKVHNVDCGRMHQPTQPLSQLDLIANVQTNSLIARFIDGGLTKQEFIKLGTGRLAKGGESAKVHEYTVNALQLDNLEEERRLQIDSETYDAMKSLSVSLLPNKLKFFFNPKHSLPQASNHPS